MTETDFAERARQLAYAHIELAAEYIESRPLGSFITKEQVDAALGGVRVDFREVQDVLRKRGSDHAFWVANKDHRLVGLFVLSAQGLRAYDNYQP